MKEANDDVAVKLTIMAKKGTVLFSGRQGKKKKEKNEEKNPYLQGKERAQRHKRTFPDVRERKRLEDVDI